MLHDATGTPVSPSGILAEIHRQNVARKDRLGGGGNIVLASRLAQNQHNLAETKRALSEAEADLAAVKQAVAAAHAELEALRGAHRQSAIEAVRAIVNSEEPIVGAGIPIKLIIRKTATHFRLTPLDLLSQRRTNNIVRPRQVAMFIAKKLTLCSLPEIGRRFGGRDHTTILHAVRKINELVGYDDSLRTDIAEIISTIEVEIATMLRPVVTASDLRETQGGGHES